MMNPNVTYYSTAMREKSPPAILTTAFYDGVLAIFFCKFPVIFGGDWRRQFVSFIPGHLSNVKFGRRSVDHIRHY